MCEEAINTLDGTEFQGSQLRVEFAHGERNTTSKNQYNHHHHHSNHYSNNNSNSNRGETKSTDTCYKCGMVGHWARECTSTGREFIRKPGRYDDRRTNDNYVKEPYNTRENRDKYIRDERYLPPPTLERGGYDRPYERYGREPPEVEYRRDYRGGYDRPYERERDRPYDRNYPDREYERFNRDNYDRNYYGPPRDGYERDGYDRRPLPPPDVTQSHYPPRGRPTSPPLPPRRGSYERGIREPQISSYRGRSPLATSRYPEPLMGPPPLRPSSPRGGGVYRRRSVSPPIRGGRASIPYSGRRSPSPIPRQSLSSRRGPSTPSPRR